MSRAATVVLSLLLAAPALAVDVDSLWAALASGGHIVVMRHALAPGTGDPANFRLDDCSTQRNLSAEGRAQAKRTGDAFRQHGVSVSRVLSSRWCRCLETARLLGFGDVEPLPDLDSIYHHPERRDEQMQALRDFVSQPFEGPSVVMVSHHVNIKALSRVYTDSGEIAVLRPAGDGRFEVLGNIPPL